MNGSPFLVAQPPLLTREGNSDSRFAFTTCLRAKREVEDIDAITIDHKLGKIFKLKAAVIDRRYS